MPETTESPTTTRSAGGGSRSASAGHGKARGGAGASGAKGAPRASAASGTTTATSDELGTTRIADSVVTKVAGIAAREVSGVYALGGSGARALGNVGQRVGLDTRTQGVSVQTVEREATVDVTVVVEYGESIREVTQEVREQIIRRVEGICGHTVTEVDILVDDLHFAGDDDDEPEPEERGSRE